MGLRCSHFPTLDRFAVTRDGWPVDVRSLTQCGYYSSPEYLRYVPLGDVSLEEVDDHLLRSPGEMCCEITDACNLGCRVCIAEAPAAQPSYLAYNTFANAIVNAPAAVERVTITGGEPTLHPELLQLLSCCASTKKCVILSTNGYAPEAAARALEVVPIGILAVSIHGPRAVHDSYVGRVGSYDRALETIRAAQGRCVGVHVLTVAIRDTLPTVAQLSEDLASLAIVEHRVSLVKPHGRVASRAVPYDEAVAVIHDLQVPHKVSIKRRDQPYEFMSCGGCREVRRERRY